VKRIDKLFVIHSNLKQFERVSFRAFKYKLKCNISTFYRCVEILKNKYGAPIVSDGEFMAYSDRSYELPPLTLQAQSLINRGQENG
jgi:hypothetical protein